MAKAPSLVLVHDGHVTLTSRLARQARRALGSVDPRTASADHPRSLHLVRARISEVEAQLSEADSELTKLATTTRAASRWTTLHDCAQSGALRS